MSYSLSPLIALLMAAAAALLFSAFRRRIPAFAEPAIALVGLAASVAFAWILWPEAGAAAWGSLVLDRMALASVMVISTTTAMAVLISPAYLEAHGEQRPGFYGLVLLASFGMAALAAAGDLIAILIAMESMSIALYALSGFLRDRPQSVEGAIKFFIMSAFATAFYCMGLAFIFGSLGSTDLAVMAERFEYVLSGEVRSVFLFGLAMVSVGLALKVAAFPFHAWAPDALDGSPTPVSLIIATSAKAAAVIAFFRLAAAIAAPGGVLWHHLAWGIAAATMLWGSLAALKQESVKRMLAYISIAQAGFMLMTLPSLAVAHAPLARALLLYIIAYSLSMAGAFAVVVALGLKPGEPLDMRHLCGLSRRRPWVAAALALFLLSLAGMPPTLGFFGRYYLVMTVVRAGDVGLAIVAAAATAILFACCARPIVAMYFREEGGRLRLEAPRGRVAYFSALVAVMVLAALAVGIFGLLPQDLLAFVTASAL